MFFSFPELPGGFIDTDTTFNIWGVNYVGDIEVGWIRRWKQAAMTLPYLLLCGILVADIARASVVQLVVFAFAWSCMVGMILLFALIFNSDVVAFGKSLLPVLVSWAVLATAMYQYDKHYPSQPRRIGLLYAQYFGVNGSLFSWKVATFQFATVVLQILGKLFLMGEIANSKSVLFDETLGHVAYWTFLAMVGINCTVPPILLQVESPFWQRAVVCYVDIFLDLMYTLVFGIYVFLTFNFQSLAPADTIGFMSSLMPLLHIVSVTRAIEIHGGVMQERSMLKRSRKGSTKAAKAEDAKDDVPLPWKAALAFFVCQVAVAVSMIYSEPSLYPLTIDPCAPCTCPNGVLDCRVREYSRSLQWLELRDIDQLTELDSAGFDGLDGSVRILNIRQNSQLKGSYSGRTRTTICSFFSVPRFHSSGTWPAIQLAAALASREPALRFIQWSYPYDHLLILLLS